MIARPPLEQISRKIVEALNPRRIVVFGSQARGDARPDSDLDLLIEMGSDLSPAERIRAVDRLFSPRQWSMDVVVFTPEEAARQALGRNSLVQTAQREGKVLYERSG